MRDIAVPSDSSTSRTLLPWLLNNRGLEPRIIEMGPDLTSMLERCDGALLIGDRALHESSEHPELVRLDLGTDWLEATGTPMVFGVFAARRDSPLTCVKMARRDLLSTLCMFEEEPNHRSAVIRRSADRVGFDEDRMRRYFDTEVRNRLNDHDESGLEQFAEQVCGGSTIHWVD